MGVVGQIPVPAPPGPEVVTEILARLLLEELDESCSNLRRGVLAGEHSERGEAAAVRTPSTSEPATPTSTTNALAVRRIRVPADHPRRLPRPHEAREIHEQAGVAVLPSLGEGGHGALGFLVVLGRGVDEELDAGV